MIKIDTQEASRLKAAFAGLEADGRRALEDPAIRRHFDATRDAVLGSKDAIAEALKNAPVFDDNLKRTVAEHAKTFAALKGSMTGEFSAATKLSRQIAEQFKATDALKASLAGEDSTTTKLRRQIAEQFKAIDALRPPSLPKLPERLPIHDLTVLPNPIHETNKRLTEIQKRFDRMESIAAEAAHIVTGLQAYAADFLVKFEKAATDNDRATKRAILIGVCAMLIALITPVAQIVYTEFWRVPADAATTQEVIADLKKEITGLQNTQQLTAEKLTEALGQSNGELSSTLKEIRDLLAKQGRKPE